MVLTRKELQKLVDIINNTYKLDFSILYNSITSEYSVVQKNNKVIYMGKIREIYAFLEGISYFMALNKNINNSSQEENELLSYLKSINTMYIKLQKTSVNSYFSQQSRVFKINIIKIESHKLYCKVEAENYTKSGYVCGGSKYISNILLVDISKFKMLSDIDTLLYEIAKKVDAEAVEAVASKRVDLGSEDLLWITPEVMYKVRWSNKEMITQKVDVIYTKY